MVMMSGPRLAAVSVFSIWVCLQLQAILPVRPECFTAVVKIERAFEYERSFLDAGTKAFQVLGNDFPDIFARFFKRLLYDAQTDHTAGDDEHLTFTEHPINIYRIVKRMTAWRSAVDQSQLRDIDNHVIQEFIDESKTFTSDDIWPSEIDVNGSALGLIRVRALYNISFGDLITGRIKSVQSRSLSLDDFIEIADVAVHNSEHAYDMYEPLRWLLHAQDAFLNGSRFEKYSEAGLYRLLSKGFDKFGDGVKAIRYIELARALEYTDETLLKEEDDLNIKYRSTSAEMDFDVLKFNLTLQYEALCRGDIEHVSSPDLKCYHQRTQIPYRPADVEVVNVDPYVALVHRTIHPNEIKAVKELALLSFARSHVLATEEVHSISENRISESAWLEDDLDDPEDLISKLSRRVEHLTGLSTLLRDRKSPCEDFQVLNYGIGGMYEPHHDFYDIDAFERYGDKDSKVFGSGNRIATWMFYINDVKAGGATVFPELGVRIPVVKGAAAFWYNLYRNGTGDSRTLHAGCPVLMGSKWVANKWMHEIDQQFRRPCSIDPNK
ncbi:prolyl 4-hydroxylase subunit alpha-1-like [Tubulanus polymorphus]|uniref:prolyl 4-hydroxylase subunit alpha-1-like n=1 Tax=Tubulanus polymorphus TaxID=672921 RepID=UPI003DA54B68